MGSQSITTADEEFEIFDDAGRRLGTAPRAVVHRDGHWHRSAQVFLSDSAGRLLLQRRAATKDLYAGLWDYSVGEHARPGESYAATAARGLAEELGVTRVTLEALGAVVPCEQRSVSFWDRELQQAFACRYDGPLAADPGEVAEVRFVTLAKLAAWVRDQPAAFTPWFAEHLNRYGYVAAANTSSYTNSDG